MNRSLKSSTPESSMRFALRKTGFVLASLALGSTVAASGCLGCGGELETSESPPSDVAATPDATEAAATLRARFPSHAAQVLDQPLAGLRVRVGDDVYESTVASQLATLAASV